MATLNQNPSHALGPNVPKGERVVGPSIPDRVAQAYYSHGLYCSSHPVPVILFAIVVVLLSCCPLLNLPLPGNVPQEFRSPVINYTIPVNTTVEPSLGQSPPHWYKEPPLAYIQQVVVKTAVHPWTENMIITDAFRAPLAEAFRLVEIISNYQMENSTLTLGHQCLHVESVSDQMSKQQSSILPQYNCLLLSPASLWQQNVNAFQEDSHLLSTILAHQGSSDGRIGIADILFGVKMKESGIKKYPVRTRQRVIMYSVTILFKEYNQKFIAGLESLLRRIYPQRSQNETAEKSIVHIYYLAHFNLLEFIPLTVTYFILFLYIYFSVRKIELVKCKLGMAFSAVVTVVASLCMSVGLCTLFGLSFTLNSKEIFPYFVVIIGLENILVLTKSVVSTPVHLDVKIRVAQGLSREGWSITKNLLTEVTILTFGFFTFIPAIQEFCIFAVVGLLSDFFLQMVFFATVLSIDVSRIDGIDVQKQNVMHEHQYSNTVFRFPMSGPGVRIVRSKSTLGLNGITQHYPTSVVAPSYSSAPILEKLPKRLRVVNFWARTRIIQRAFMVCVVAWIMVLLYNSGIVEHFTLKQSTVTKMPSFGKEEFTLYISSVKNLTEQPDSSLDAKTVATYLRRTENQQLTMNFSSSEPLPVSNSVDSAAVLPKLKHTNLESWQKLSYYHWPTLLGMYNISLAGHYVSILPSIHLSIPISPEVALGMRHRKEVEASARFGWQALAAALDPLEISDGDTDETGPGASKLGMKGTNSEDYFSAPSPLEMCLFVTLSIPSVIFLVYIMVVLYRCICTRNYAEWRASWWGEENQGQDAYTQVVMEAIPLVLEGHQQDIECIKTDGNFVVSSCLADQILVWDSQTGDCVANIDRRGYFRLSSYGRQGQDVDTEAQEELLLSDYESGSPPSRSDPGLERGPKQINTPLTDMEYEASYCGLRVPEHWDTKGAEPIGVRKDPSCSGYSVSSKPAVAISSCAQEEWLDSQLCNSVASKLTRQSEVFRYQPDLSLTITTDFANMGYDRTCSSYVAPDYEKTGFDFSKFQRVYTEHRKHVMDDDVYLSKLGRSQNSNAEKKEPATRLYTELDKEVTETSSMGRGHKRNNSSGQMFSENSGPELQNPRQMKDLKAWLGLSQNLNVGCVPGDLLFPDMSSSSVQSSCLHSPGSPLQMGAAPHSGGNVEDEIVDTPPIWCLHCEDSLIVVGCSNGRLEFWETSTGAFKCVYDDGSGVGVTDIKIIGNRIVAARLSGVIDFLELESYCKGKQMDGGFKPYRRTHVRRGSTGSVDGGSLLSLDEDLRCAWLNTTRAHQQPIMVLECEGGRVLTGSQDHTLKVIRQEDQCIIYTLHGHYGPITSLFIDKMSPMASGSGSQDGMLCVWDLLTGACVYSIQAHDGSVTALTYSASYVISMGSDEKLCVWERFQGHLLNTIQVNHTYCTNIVMLTHNMLVTSKQGSLVLWDVRTGDPVKVVRLGHNDASVFVRQLIFLGDSVVCDYGHQLRLVRFPMITEKIE